MVKEYRAQLRADFRQYYGVSFDDALRKSVVEAADLAAMLPRSSRTFVSINPEYAWEQEHYMLAGILNAVNLILWGQTKDGQKNKNRPKPIKPPKREEEKEAYTIEELNERLSRPRKEV